MEIRIPLLAGSISDLTLLDFSFKNIRIFNIESEGFKHYIEKLHPDNKDRNFHFFEDLIEKIYSPEDNLYAIVKLNPREGYNYQDLVNVWKFLLLLYPSVSLS